MIVVQPPHAHANLVWGSPLEFQYTLKQQQRKTDTPHAHLRHTTGQWYNAIKYSPYQEAPNG